MRFEEFVDADEVFACGTAAEVAPIAEIDGHAFRDSVVTREIAAAYAAAVRGESRSGAHWLTEV